MIQLANFEERTFYVMLGKVVTSVDVTFTFQMTEEEFTATLTPVTSTLRASKFTFQATTYPEGQYIVKFVETGQTEVLATVAGFVSGNPIFATSQYNTYNDDGTSTTYVPSDDQGLVPSVSQKLRVSTIDEVTDVSYVRYLKVTNGTLTDNGDNSVTLDTGGGGAEALNDLTDVTITGFPANDVLWYDAISGQWENVDLNLPLLSDTKGTPSDGQYLKYVSGFWQPATINLPSPPPSTTDGLPEGSTNLYYTEARVSANTDVTANTAKTGITQAQADAIVANTAKVGITTQQATEITLNSAKTSYPSADATKLAGIEDGAEVNVQADWNATTGDALILNKPTIPSAIGDLSDVPSSLGTSGQVLAVNSGGTALEYVAQSGGGGGVTLDYARLSMGSDVLVGGASQQNFSSPTPQKAKFNTQDDTEGTGLSVSTANNRITITNGGYYRLTSNMFWSGTGSNRLGPAMSFYVNGSEISGKSMGYVRMNQSINEASTNLTRVIELSANDYVEVYAYNESSVTSALYVSDAIFEVESVGGLTGAQGAQGASGTSYDVTTITTSTTLSSSHTTKYLVCNSASAMNLTVPASASYDTYAEFVIEQRGAGQVTVVADAGVTIHSTETLKSGAQYAVMGLKRTDTNTYVLTGEREAAP